MDRQRKNAKHRADSLGLGCHSCFSEGLGCWTPFIGTGKAMDDLQSLLGLM